MRRAAAVLAFTADMRWLGIAHQTTNDMEYKRGDDPD